MHPDAATGPSNSSDQAEINSLLADQKWVLLFFPPFLLFLGITGNMLTLLILRSKSLRHNFVAQFLSYLAICNLLNLFVGLTRLWIIGLVDADIRLLSSLACQVHLAFSIIFHVIANWTMVCVTACKLLFVSNPIRANGICTKAAIHTIMFTLITFFTIFEVLTSSNQYTMVKLGNGRLKYCGINHGGHVHLIQVTMFYFIPGILILIFNVCIIITVNRKPDTIDDSAIARKKERIMHLLAYILFVCDVQILILELPYAIQYALGERLFDNTDLGRTKYTVFYNVSAILVYTNYSVNFVIYCFFGDHFRAELRRIFRPCLKVCCKNDSRWVESTLEISYSQSASAENVTASVPRISFMNIFDNPLHDRRYSSERTFTHGKPDHRRLSTISSIDESSPV
ncbi:FMRFamide receptor-like [Physella acuta]|uniref:FMRFamide receptor-like n=1 Tax=Physella acuta TaxID=109671 RepID=UPI0027DDB323|nr:FMRFamide receptor-like [Physella acuta]